LNLVWSVTRTAEGSKTSRARSVNKKAVGL
jgi:hypothetical protein